MNFSPEVYIALGTHDPDDVGYTLPRISSVIENRLNVIPTNSKLHVFSEHGSLSRSTVDMFTEHVNLNNGSAAGASYAFEGIEVGIWDRPLFDGNELITKIREIEPNNPSLFGLEYLHMYDSLRAKDGRLSLAVEAIPDKDLPRLNELRFQSGQLTHETFERVYKADFDITSEMSQIGDWEATDLSLRNNVIVDQVTDLMSVDQTAGVVMHLGIAHSGVAHSLRRVFPTTVEYMDNGTGSVLFSPLGVLRQSKIHKRDLSNVNLARIAVGQTVYDRTFEMAKRMRLEDNPNVEQFEHVPSYAARFAKVCMNQVLRTEDELEIFRRKIEQDGFEEAYSDLALHITKSR